jgi:hypothetical protein
LSIELTQRSAPPYIISLERAILEALVYSDIFDYPLRIEELFKYLSVPIVRSDLNSYLNGYSGMVEFHDGYYHLKGRENLINQRKNREIASRHLLNRAIWFGRILGSLPFIRMVALTGSLALQNCDETADIDYLLVTAHGRVWTARAFALLFGRITALFGNVICPNLIISDQALEWQQQDAYSAHELCQMIPISGRKDYLRLRQINSWTNKFLPNAQTSCELRTTGVSGHSKLQFLLELPLLSKIGDKFEAWEMNRKINRLTKQAGYGPETKFNQDICQGNFNQHGLHTKMAYQRRLGDLGL